MMLSERGPRPGSTLPLAAAAEQMLRHLETIGRKPTTLNNYRSIMRAHLLPRFGKTGIEHLRRDQVEAFAAEMLRDGKAPEDTSQCPQAALADPELRPGKGLMPGECLRSGPAPETAGKLRHSLSRPR
jgi:hypothetical protein